jgi:integrase
MATIRQIPSGWWQGIIRKKGFPEQSKTFATNDECKKWAIDVEAQMNRGIFSDLSEAESLTLAEGLKRYLKEITPRKKGFEMETIRINVLLRHKLTSKTFATFKRADAVKYRDELLRAGKSPSTVNKELSIVSHLFEVANKEWSVNCTNPIKQIAKPKINNSRTRRLSDVEFKYLQLALKDESGGTRTNKLIKDIVVFAIETAMRQAEILSLTWADINIDKRVATLKDTKNGTSRAVPLSTIAIGALKDESDKVVKLKRGKVFGTTASALKQSYRRAVKRARAYYEADTNEDDHDDNVLIDLTFHDLRHEATSRLANTFALHELMKITGHSDSKMLARYYHPRAEDLAKRLA